jgi:Flp pilus assembly pilin Flp
VISRINVLIGEIVGTPDLIWARLRREQGQAFVEYTLVILMIAVVVATGTMVKPFREALDAALTAISTAISDNIPG